MAKIRSLGPIFIIPGVGKIGHEFVECPDVIAKEFEGRSNFEVVYKIEKKVEPLVESPRAEEPKSISVEGTGIPSIKVGEDVAVIKKPYILPKKEKKF